MKLSVKKYRQIEWTIKSLRRSPLLEFCGVTIQLTLRLVFTIPILDTILNIWMVFPTDCLKSLCHPHMRASQLRADTELCVLAAL